MDFEEAKKILSEATRSELRDHAFGDREVFWEKDGKEVAGGYFGGGGLAQVWLNKNPNVDDKEDRRLFEGEEARKLAECGTLGEVHRNDETGPDTFTEGDVMPGLSKGDVFHELTGSYLDES